MIVRAPAVGRGVFLGAAAVASFAPLPVQIGFAAITLGIVGMAHGAGDLAIVEDRRRPLFLALYGATALACLFWWIAHPAVALPVFLLASAVHFGVEDAPADRPVERILRGIGLVATPAALHRAELDQLLRVAGGSERLATALIDIYAIAGLLAGALLLLIGVQRHDARLLAGTAALLVLPPLVGFSVGFLILHALPQTVERQRQLGTADLASYLRVVAPVLAAAIVIVGVIGLVLLNLEATGVRSLFAGIAALAIPHLLVTPWFEPAGSTAHGQTATGAAIRRGVPWIGVTPHENA